MIQSRALPYSNLWTPLIWGMYTEIAINLVPECGVMSAAAMYGLRVGGIVIAVMDVNVFLWTASMVPAYLWPVDSSMGTGC